MNPKQQPNTTTAAALAIGVDPELLARVMPILRRIKVDHHIEGAACQIQIHLINGRYPNEQWLVDANRSRLICQGPDCSCL